jgi:dTDP-4-dehydrorhamnose 3,5-epimerase
MMRAHATALPGVLVLETPIFTDERGWFMPCFHQDQFGGVVGGGFRFVQDNLSSSHRGALRGLHYQLPPCAQGKLVQVLRGSAFDAIVDVRRDSPTFRRWVGLRLDAGTPRQVWIPPGYAHGCLALENDTQILYKVTAGYAPEHERTIAWDDPDIGIDWPPLDCARLLSPRDASAPRLAVAQTF